MKEVGEMSKLMKFNTFFRKYMTIWVLLSIFLGLAFGYRFPKIKLDFLVLPLVFIMIYAMIIPTSFLLFARAFRLLKEIALGLLSIVVVAPVIAFATSSILCADYDLITGFTLAGAVPPGGMITAWTGLLGGNIPIAIVLQTLTLIISIVQVPYTLQLSVGAYIEIPTSLLMSNLTVLVVLPLIVGFLTRQAIVRTAGDRLIDNLRPIFPVLSGMAALSVVFVAASLQASRIIANPSVISHAIVVAVVYYFLLFVIETVISRLSKLNYESSIPVIYGGATKNLSIAIALAIQAFSNSNIVLAVIACFMVQMPMASVFFRAVPRMLGKAGGDL